MLIKHESVHVDAALSNYSTLYRQANFIGDIVCPRVGVQKASDYYFEWGKEHLRIASTERRPSATSHGVELTLSSTQYVTKSYGAHTLIPKAVFDNADAAVDVRQAGTRLVVNTVDLAREKRVADLFLTSTNYPTGHVKALTGSQQWNDDGNTSTPLKDILGAIDQIFKSCRVAANTIILPYQVALQLSENHQFVGRKQFTHDDLVERLGLPTTIKGLRVVIGGAGYVTTKRGQTETLGNIWGNDVVICHVNPVVTLEELTFAKTFDWMGRVVETWWDQDRRSEKIELNEQGLVEKIICSSAAYLIQDAISE